MGKKYGRMNGQKPEPVCVAHNHDFTKGRDFQPTVMNTSQNF